MRNEIGNNDLKQRTKKFALDIIKLVESLPKTPISQILGKQLLRAGTSVGANYRAACRARSSADFIAKMGIVEEEADESIYWMELLCESGIVPQNMIDPLKGEASELLAITVSSIRTARKGSR
ncbi:MAG: four helix bundle protein [Nitrospirae bacterium]|nr:four helix bundle protein [Nitrospirota bacterium]